MAAPSDRMRKVLAINLLDAFTNTFVAALLPLLLISRGYSTTSIGLIFALLPLAFLAARLLFASIADQLSFRPFFVLNAAAAAGAYFLYGSPIPAVGYNVGRVFDGISQASIWAVNRSAAIVDRGKATAAHASATLIQYRQVSLGFGALAAGIVASYTSIENAIIFAGILECAALAIAFRLPALPSSGQAAPAKRIDWRKAFSALHPRGKPRMMWRNSAIMCMRVCAISFASLNFIIPVFLKASGHGLLDIGILMTAYFLSEVFVIRALKARSELKYAHAGLAVSLFAAGALLLAFPLSWVPLFVPLMLLGVGDGFATFEWEALIAAATNESPTLSADIGLMHVAPNLIQAAALITAGVLVSTAGYAPIFILAVVFYAAFVLFASRALGARHSGVLGRLRYQLD